MAISRLLGASACALCIFLLFGNVMGDQPGRPFEEKKAPRGIAGAFFSYGDDLTQGVKLLSEIWKDILFPNREGSLLKTGIRKWSRTPQEVLDEWDDADDDYDFPERPSADEEKLREREYFARLEDQAWERMVAETDEDVPSLEEFRAGRAQEKEDERFMAAARSRSRAGARTLEEGETLPSLDEFQEQHAAWLESVTNSKPGNPSADDPCKPGRQAEYLVANYTCFGQPATEAEYLADLVNCLKKDVTVKSCICPIDYPGEYCSETRAFTCDVMPDPPLPDECSHFPVSESGDHLLSGDPPCLWHSKDDLFNFTVRLDCNYVDPLKPEDYAATVTLGSYGEEFSNVFTYWLKDEGKLYFRSNPWVNLRWKAFNFVHLGDRSQEFFTYLTQKRWTGDELIAFQVNLTKTVDNRGFTAGGRTYFEIGLPYWHNQRGLAGLPVPVRNFIDYTDLPPLEKGGEFWTPSAAEWSSVQILAVVFLCVVVLFTSLYVTYRITTVRRTFKADH